MLKCIVLSLGLGLYFCPELLAQPNRALNLAEQDVGEIHTSVGYSTILQFDSRPISVVIGDQDSFRVEYLGNSITIKPVISGARTNMFVYTGYDRFSFRLVTGKSDAVDYLVEIKKKKAKENYSYLDFNTSAEATEFESAPRSVGTSMTKRKIGKIAQCYGVTLTIDSVSNPIGKPWLLLSFSLSSEKEMDFKKDELFLTRAKKKMGFHTLYLEATKLAPKIPVNGTFLLSTKSKFDSMAVHFSPESLLNTKCRLQAQIDLPQQTEERHEN